MKIKGITIWEQYVEFLVLIVAGAVFVFFTMLQFIGNPNQVSVAGTDYSPSNVDSLLEEEAVRVSAGLAPDAPSPVAFPDHVPALPDFVNMTTESVSPAPTVARMWPHLSPEGGGDGPVRSDDAVPYIVPAVDAPHSLVAKQSFEALTPEAVQTYPELQTRFPAEPYDIGWITVAGKFNVKDLLEKFKKRGPNGEQPYNDRWYGNRIDLLDVKLEREEYSSDGTWFNRTVLEPIPGQFSYRMELASDMNVQTRDIILGELDDAALQQAVIQPDFLPTVGDWLPPNPNQAQEVVDDDVELDDNQIEILRQQRLLRNVQQRYQRVSTKLDELGGELTEAGNSGAAGGAATGAGGSGGGGGTGGPSGNAGTRGSGGGAPVVDNTAAQIRMTRTKRSLERQIEKIEKVLEGLGAMVVEIADVESSPDEFVVWAHDMTIERGTTYRYRLTVEVYNPLFARKLHLPKSQHKLADQITMQSEPSEWTEPMLAEQWLKVFVTKVTAPSDQQAVIGGLGMGDARVDVFRFQHGRWWNKSYSVEPGDRIGAPSPEQLSADQPRITVDFGTDWYLLDVIEEVGASREDRERGRAGAAMMQSLSRPDMVVMRDPSRESTSRLLQRLRDEVQLSEIETVATGP